MEPFFNEEAFFSSQGQSADRQTVFGYPPFSFHGLCQRWKENIVVNEVFLTCDNINFRDVVFRLPLQVPDGVYVHIVCDATKKIQRTHGRSFTVLWLVEPPAIRPDAHLFARTARVDAILTYDLELLKLRPDRGLFVPILDFTVKPPNWGIHVAQKTRMVVCILSTKNEAPGHRLRHAVKAAVEARPDLIGLVDFVGGAVQPFQAKFPDFTEPYRYAIVIENSQHDLYVSEKIVDHLVTGSVVLYFGSSLERIVPGLDTRSILRVDTVDDILDLLTHNITVAEYTRLLPVVQQNVKALSAYFNTIDSPRVVEHPYAPVKRVLNLLVGQNNTLFGCAFT